MDGRDWVDGYPRTARNVASEELLAVVTQDLERAMRDMETAIQAREQEAS